MILDPVKYNFQHFLIIQAELISVNISTNSTVSIITENNYLFTCCLPIIDYKYCAKNHVTFIFIFLTNHLADPQ